MTRIRFVVVGKPSQDYAGLIREYEKRLNKYCSFEVLELKDNAKAADIISLLKSKIICLDSSGVQFASESFAELLKEDLTFVVGGSEGLAAEVKKLGMLISFSRMTFPHQMARLILAEQVYRGFTILRKEKYHK